MEIIKSIQRGVSNESSITINEVNPNKCIVLIDSIVTTTRVLENLYNESAYTHNYTAYGNSKGGATVAQLTSTKLTMSNIQNTFSWQVIEFY